jgi:hypothetical protein
VPELDDVPTKLLRGGGHHRRRFRRPVWAGDDGSTLLDEKFPPSGIAAFSVERTPDWARSPERLEKKITYAIEDELILNGLLPALRTRPAGLLVSFYLGPKPDQPPTSETVPAKHTAIVVECREAQSERVIWRGVADVVAEMRGANAYSWEGRLTEAARMLVRRFTAEMSAN